MITTEELKKIIHDSECLIEDIDLFYRLLDNIKLKFPEFDPLIVLSESQLLRWEIDPEKEGECICKQKHLKYLFHCEFNEIKYILGSECVEHLDKLKNISNVLNLTDEAKELINKFNSLYEAFQKLKKKKCVRFNKCGKYINTKNFCNKKKVFQDFCGYCRIADNTNNQSQVKCLDCNQFIPYKPSIPRCQKCFLKTKGFVDCKKCGKIKKDNGYKICYNCNQEKKHWKEHRNIMSYDSYQKYYGYS